MNNTYGILEWSNEHSLGSYPLAKVFNPVDFLVDATFVQFDGFVPVLKQLKVTQTTMTITITTDAGDVDVLVSKPGPSDYAPELSARVVSSKGRHLGYLVFGQGLVTVFATKLNDTVKVNIPFHQTCVRGVNSNSGVYSIEGYAGAVNITTGSSPAARSIFFDTSDPVVTWNAGFVSAQQPGLPLKTINGVTPVNNAVFIQDSDLIKVTPQGNGVLIALGVALGYDIISPATKYA